MPRTTPQTTHEAAFEEYKVARQVSTGNGELYCSQVGRDGKRVLGSRETGGTPFDGLPGWFVRNELGFDGPVGTRLYVMVPQEELDQRHMDRAHRPPVAAPAPPPRSRKRETKHTRRAKLEQLAARALMGRWEAA
jgi:hypothetical protein